MKKVVLFLFGLIPFLVGFLINEWLDSVLPAKLIGIIFLVFWVFVGFISYKFEKTYIKSTIIAHFPAFITLLLIMYQSIILGAYWPNFLGTVTQLYYLPVLNLSLTFTRLFWPSTIGISLIVLIALLFMFVAFYFGNYLRKKWMTFIKQR